ncbi:MAG TPA: 4-oxalocrotonate tautomerase [Rhodocyclaceae bacterium]|nr:4-oxalocrotonate tautomerase [Rhodocyclaceae bacterium]
MPTFNVQIFTGRTQEQKREFVEAITEASCRTLGCTPESVDVVITEVKKEDWATGGVFWSEK